MLENRINFSAKIISTLIYLLILNNHIFSLKLKVAASYEVLPLKFSGSQNICLVPVFTLERFLVFKEFIEISKTSKSKETFNVNLSEATFRYCLGKKVIESIHIGFEIFKQSLFEILGAINYLDPVDPSLLYINAIYITPGDTDGAEFLLKLYLENKNILVRLINQFKQYLIEIINKQQKSFQFPKVTKRRLVFSHGIKSQSMILIENTIINTKLYLGLDILDSKFKDNEQYRKFTHKQLDYTLSAIFLYLLTNNIESSSSYKVTFKGEENILEELENRMYLFELYWTTRYICFEIQQLVFENCKITKENIIFLEVCLKPVNLTFKFCYILNTGLKYILKRTKDQNKSIEIEFIHSEFEYELTQLLDSSLKLQKLVCISKDNFSAFKYQNYFLKNSIKTIVRHLTLTITPDFMFNYSSLGKIFPYLLNLNLSLQIPDPKLQNVWFKQLNDILATKKIVELSIEVISGIFILSNIYFLACESLKSVTLIGIIIDVPFKLNKNTCKVYFENVFFYKQEEFTILPEVKRFISFKNFKLNKNSEESFSFSNYFKENLRSLTIDFYIWDIKHFMYLEKIHSCKNLKVCNYKAETYSEINSFIQSSMFLNVKKLEMENFENGIKFASLPIFTNLEVLIVRNINVLFLGSVLLENQNCSFKINLRRLEIYSKSYLKLFDLHYLTNLKNIQEIYFEGKLNTLEENLKIVNTLKLLDTLEFVYFNIFVY